MNYFSSSSWGPSSTPKVIKWLIIVTSITAILSAGIQEIFDLLGYFPGPQAILSLSWWGLKQGFFWEPITFLFVQGSDSGLSFSFFIVIFFNMYILWILGRNITQAIGNAAFLRLYLMGGIGAGLIALLSMMVTGQHEMISGIIPALLAVVTVWTMAFPETEIYLLFLVPFKAKWMIIGALGVLCFTSLVHLEISHLILYISAVAIGYGYAAIAWGWPSPFPITSKFDAWLGQTGLTMRRRIPRFRSSEDLEKGKGKIIDITTAQPPKDDDAFVDAMLAKISKYGEESLSWSERRRLQKVSERKMGKK